VRRPGRTHDLPAPMRHLVSEHWQDLLIRKTIPL
jgi:hypothetical protein